MFFGWYSSEKSPIAGIRVYIKDQETADLRSTNRGITMGVRSWNSFRTSVRNETLIKKATSVMRQSVIPLQTVEADYGKLLAKLSKILHADWMARIQETCELCVQMRMLCEEPVHRNAAHSCHLGQENVSLPAGVAHEIMKQLQTSSIIKGETASLFANVSYFRQFCVYRVADVHKTVG
jgi:hypothetical protein